MITCIMPTLAKRRALWPVAIEMFARQGHLGTRAELLIGLDDVGYSELYASDIKIIASRFGIADRVSIMITDATTLGGKRNQMIKGVPESDWIMFWDDDDWHHPERIATTIARARMARRIRVASPTAPILCGNASMLIHEIVDPRRRWFEYAYNGVEPYYVGGTLCFERKLWERFPFAEAGEGATIGDEAWWQLAIPRTEVFRWHLDAPSSIYCAFIHASNTANTQAPNGAREWRQDPSLRSVIPPAELARWEAAHANMLLDRVVDLDPRDVLGDGGERRL